jgi:hypothetical protein
VAVEFVWVFSKLASSRGTAGSNPDLADVGKVNLIWALGDAWDEQPLGKHEHTSRSGRHYTVDLTTGDVTVAGA